MKDPQVHALRSIRRKCSEIRARRVETGPDPWQEAVALYLASPHMAGKTPMEKTHIGRILGRARRLLEAAGLPTDPEALTKADRLYLHAWSGYGSGEEKRQILGCLGRFLEFWRDCEILGQG